MTTRDPVVADRRRPERFEFHGQHPELYRYMTKSGLEDLTNTNTLWVTHHRDLNDFLPNRLYSPMPLPTCRHINFFTELVERLALTGAA